MAEKVWLCSVCDRICFICRNKEGKLMCECKKNELCQFHRDCPICQIPFVQEEFIDVQNRVISRFVEDLGIIPELKKIQIALDA